MPFLGESADLDVRADVSTTTSIGPDAMVSMGGGPMDGRAWYNAMIALKK